MWDALKNPVVYTTGATALAALAALFYNIWQDHRRLRIDLKPLQWSCSPVDQTEAKFRISFFMRVVAFNPGRTPNRIRLVRTWRDGQSVQNTFGMFQNVDIAPYELANLDLHMIAFESTSEAPQQAYQSISMIEIEVEALRGRRRMAFEPQAFRASQ